MFTSGKKPTGKFNAAPNRSTRRRRAVDAAVRALPIELLEKRVLLSTALSGQLDPTFGTEGDGIVGLPIASPIAFPALVSTGQAPPTSYFDEANGIAMESGGKFIVVGTSYETVDDPIQSASDPIKYSDNFAVARFLPDGTLDPAFGVLITDFSTAAVRSKANPLDNDDVAFRVAVLSNNDILVVGLSNDEVAVALYSAEGATIGKTVLGAPMDQFGDWAIPTTVIPTTGTNANTIDFFVGGSVYSALTGDNLEAYEVSINANSGASALVNTFGNGGGFNYNFTSYSNDFVNGVAVDASGNVILTGESDSSTYNPISGHTNFFLMRLTPAGVLDKTFNSDGVADVLDFGSTYSGGTSVTVQTNGDILATAWGNGQGEVIRFLPSGLLDPAFGARGIVPLGDFFATRVIAQPDGQILIIGGDGTPINFGPNGWADETNFGPTTADTVLLVDQLNTDGSFDSTFGNTGVSGEASTESVLSSTDPEFGELDLAGMNGIYDPLTGKIIVIGTDVGPAGAVGDVNLAEITSQTNSEFILADFIDDVAPPTSVLAANDINTPGQATIDFTVTYADTVLVEASTIGSSNVLVTGPNGYSQFGQLVSTSSLGANAQSITATYQIIPGGGAVTIADNGLYTVTLEPNQIADTSGNVAPLRKLGNFAISVGATQPTLPTATLTDATSETSPGTTTYDFIVTYSDPTAISFASLGNGNILVTGPGFFSQNATLVNASPGADSANIVAVYSITAPGPTGSTFNAVDDGTYTIALEAGQVSDTFASPNYVVGGALGQFTVDISPTTGTVNALSPTASLTAIPSVTTPLSNVSFLVTYTDTTGLLFSTLGDGNIVVDGPNLYSEPATLVSAAPAANSTAIVAEYSVPAPPGESTFTTSDNGSYIVIMQGDQVSDTEAVPEVVPLGVLGQFQVNIAAGTVGSAAGTSPLTAIFQPLATLTSTVNSIPFTVTYTDSTPINIASISSNNILVDGPGSFSQFATFVSASPAQDADTIVATYHIVPPAPIPPATGPTYFGTSNNGTYVIILEPGQVSDTATPANFASVGLLGQFVVNVALANNVAPIPPTATLSAVSPVTVPVTAISVTVVYTDSASIIESSLSQNNAAILVTGPNGYTRNATVSGIQAATNGWSVTYSVTAPIEYFNPTDNGTYTISLANNEVFDQASQTFAAATLGTFSVNIAGVSLGANGILTVNGTDQADSIEFTLVGSNIRVLYNNSATGYPTGNVTGIVCNGLGGNDTITVDPGLAGANSILVNSTLMGGPGDDTINGGSGADSIGGGQGNNVLFGGPGNDTIVAGNGNSLLRGGEGDDLLRGGQGNDTMRGGQGNDTFFAGHGDNVIYGGAGDDVIYANNGFADTIVGGAGNNTATIDYNLDLLYNIQTIL